MLDPDCQEAYIAITTKVSIMAETKLKQNKASRLGRPRAFDRDQALERALDLFWRNGYEGASLSDLTEAMGINPPSLYAAFGNKEELFCKALDRYVERHDEFLREVLASPAQAIMPNASGMSSVSAVPPMRS
jgi:AcrR family transcriptional regulator